MKKRLQLRNYDGGDEFNPKEYYDFRVKTQDVQLPKLLSQGKITAEKARRVMQTEKNAYEANINDLAQVEKLNRDIAIIIPTYFNQLPWLKSCLASCKKLGYYILLAYDGHFHRTQELREILPAPSVLAMADAVVMKHRTHFFSVGYSHMWDMYYGLTLLTGWGFPYVFAINGDCIMEKPENFPQIIEMLGDNDIICQTFDPIRGYCGTAGMLGRTAVLYRFFREYVEKMYIKSGTTEGRLYQWLVANQIKVAPVKNTVENRNFKVPFEAKDAADWHRILGFRHLHAEQKVRQRKKLPPVERQYIDFGPDFLYVGGAKYRLKRYYDTNDEKYLKEWWGD